MHYCEPRLRITQLTLFQNIAYCQSLVGGEDDDMGNGEEDCESGSEVYSEDGGG